ncbi:MAG: hypothetical protein ACR2MF_00915 [Chthoniobacterales bacterium]
MKAIVITLLCCLIALACVLILSNRLPSAAHSKSLGPDEHYKLVQFDEQLGVKSIFKIETNSGRTWRLTYSTVPRKEGSPIGVEGWEEISQSFSNEVYRTIARFGPMPDSAAPSKATATPTSSPH